MGWQDGEVEREIEAKVSRMGLAKRIEARKAFLKALKDARARTSKLKWALREKLGKASKGKKSH